MQKTNKFRIGLNNQLLNSNPQQKRQIQPREILTLGYYKNGKIQREEQSQYKRKDIQQKYILEKHVQMYMVMNKIIKKNKSLYEKLDEFIVQSQKQGLTYNLTQKYHARLERAERFRSALQKELGLNAFLSIQKTFLNFLEKTLT